MKTINLLDKNSNPAILLAGIIALIIGVGVARFVFTSLLPPMLENHLTISFAGVLASINYVETCRVESVSKVAKNSFRAVVPDLASLHDSKESSIIWLEQYISYLKATK